MIKKIFRITIAVLLALWIGGYALFIVNIVETKKPITMKKTDAIIVLTGGNNRVKTGIELFSTEISPQLFITGVHQSVTKSEITSMWGGDKKLPDCCIILGYKATTTIENALEAKEWINSNNIKSIYLVTSAYHMDRALLEFKNIIKDTNIIPHPIKIERSLKDLKFWEITFSEYNKILFRTALIMIERH